MALRMTQPVTEMSTRNISWGGKGGRCVGLTTLPPLCADCLEIWEPHPLGTLRNCRGVTFFIITIKEQRDLVSLTAFEPRILPHK